MQDKIDFVIPWVDGNDALWLQERDAAALKQARPVEINRAEYRNWDLLRYWFRGVEKFAPWVNKVHFVTWGHLPDWLNTDHPKLNIVTHSDYIPSQYLPTFSSHTIDLNLHRIRGLEEKFVYFNDDMFLTAPTTPSCFFRGDLPAATAVLTPWRIVKNDWFVAPGNNVAIINDHFSAHDVVLNNFSKWFNPRYGKYLLVSLAMLPYPCFYGFFEFHLPNSFLKSTFEEVWEKEEAILDATSGSPFRTTSDVNQWLIENWQFCKGAFSPRSPRFGKAFYLGDYSEQDLEELCSCIQASKYKVVCVNDGPLTQNKFLHAREAIDRAFNCILPDKCSYER